MSGHGYSAGKMHRHKITDKYDATYVVDKRTTENELVFNKKKGSGVMNEIKIVQSKKNPCYYYLYHGDWEIGTCDIYNDKIEFAARDGEEFEPDTLRQIADIMDEIKKKVVVCESCLRALPIKTEVAND